MISHEEYLKRFDDFCKEINNGYQPPDFSNELKDLADEVENIVGTLNHLNDLLNVERSKILEDARSSSSTDLEKLSEDLLAKHNECLEGMSD